MNRKNLISAAFFLLLLTATIVVIFQGNDMNTVVAFAMQTLSPVYLVAAALTALFFTSAEGIMIWYLLDSLEGKPLFFLHQIFVCGIFYSGITPSATGGQPMQLYYMQKEGHKDIGQQRGAYDGGGGIANWYWPLWALPFCFLPHAADGIS